MTVHCCRDLVLGGTLGFSSGSYDSMWALSVFMQGVLNYTYESSAGSLVPPAYSAATVSYSASSSIISMTQPTCLVTSSAGSACLLFSRDAINLSTLTSIACPGGSTTTPVGLWVAVRSANYPLANSGIFLVTSQSLSLNALFIDYRSTSLPFAENTAYVTASLWLPPPGSDNTNYGRTGGSEWTTFNALAGNGNTGQYQTQGSATCPRMILQSPDPSGYQVRLCFESTADTTGFLPPGFLSVYPGFSGSAGDFPTQNWATPTAAPHLHALQWFNLPSYPATSYYPVGGALVGFDITQTTGKGANSGFPAYLYSQNKGFYAWGSDQTGTCAVFERGYPYVYQVQANTYDSFIIFGIPSDETQPLPADNVNRLFVIGVNQYNADRVQWACGTYSTDGVAGLAFSLDKKLGPISCVMSSYTWAANQETSYGPGTTGASIFDTVAGDTPFLEATELISVDLIAGTIPSLYSFSSTNIQQLNCEPRRMGRVPFARQGRATGQATWATADTSMQWFHISNGVYLPWGGITGL